MRDLKMSVVCGADGKFTIGLTALFDHADDALSFNERLVDLCKQVLDGARAKVAHSDPLTTTEGR